MNNNSALNPNVVKTALDQVFFPAFNGEMHPGIVTAESSQVFNQETTDRSAEIVEVFKGAGLWEQRSEEQDVPQAPSVLETTKLSLLLTLLSHSISQRISLTMHSSM